MYKYVTYVLLSTLVMLTIAIILSTFIPTVAPPAGFGLGVIWLVNLIAIGINEGGPWS